MSCATGKSLLISNIQTTQKTLQFFQGFRPLVFQFAAGDGVFVPEIFHHGDKPPLFGIEVTVEFVADEIVELFQDKFAGLGLGELTADGRENGIGLGKARLQGRLVLVQGGDLFLVGLVLGIKFGQLGLHLPDQLLAFGLELVTAESFELELEGQLVGLGFQVGLVLLDPILDGLDRLVLGLEVFQFLAGRSSPSLPLEIVDEFLEGLLDNGGGDFLVLLRFVAGDFLGGFHGFGQFALGLADLALPASSMASASAWKNSAIR